MAQLRSGHRPRRTAQVAAAYKAHRDVQRRRADSWGLDPSLAAVNSYATGGHVLLDNPFPYDVEPGITHYVLWANPGSTLQADVDAAWLALSGGGARAALDAMGIRDDDAVHVLVNAEGHRSVRHIPHAHVFVCGDALDCPVSHPAWKAAGCALITPARPAPLAAAHRGQRGAPTAETGDNDWRPIQMTEDCSEPTVQGLSAIWMIS